MLKRSKWQIINALRILFAVKHERRIWCWMHEDGDIEIL